MSGDEIIKAAKVGQELKDINIILAVLRTLDAEKRTHLAGLRTGIGILTIPFSLLTILIATSEYYSIGDVLLYMVALVIGIITMSGIGGYLVYRYLIRIRKTDRLRRNVCVSTESLLAEVGMKID